MKMNKSRMLFYIVGAVVGILICKAISFKEPPTAATVGGEETKIKGITIDITN